LLDIIQNSIIAKASKITISIHTEASEEKLEITVEDNGTGMAEELLSRVTSPFTTTRTTRKIGMGIPLFKASCEMASGNLEIISVEGKGTRLKASMKINHIDRLPLGDIGETAVAAIMTNPEVEYELLLGSKQGSFRFDSNEVEEKLGDVPITEYEVMTWIREYINEGVRMIFGGVLDEVIS